MSQLDSDGEPFDQLIDGPDGTPVELVGRPRGAQVRVALRPAAILKAERDRQSEAFSVREGELAARERETGALANMLSEAPLVAWRRGPDGRIIWSAGAIHAAGGEIGADQAARLAAERERGGSKTVGEGSERFFIELDDTIVLDAVETDGPDGTRLGVAVDTSGALSAERTLSRFVRTMTDTFAHLNVGLAIFDQNQTLVLFNPAVAGMWQADPAQLARRPTLWDVLDELRANRRMPEMADFHTWRETLFALFENPEQADFEELWHLSDGTDIRVLARPHPRGSLAFVFEDVTERLRLEQRFRHSVDLRRATLDHLDEGLTVFGPDGRLELVNQAFHDIWGTDGETVRPAMHVSEILPLVRGLTVETEVWDRLMTVITSAATREIWTARLTMGDGRILGARFAPLPDGSTMAAFADETDRERIALALRERNEALEAVEEMRAAVLDRISHRLRTPLNTIFGFGQLITDSRLGPLTDAQRGYAVGILEAASHLLDTVNDVTELASLEIEPLPDERSATSLGEVLLVTGQLLEKRATEAGVSIEITAPEAGCAPECEPARLRQISFGMMTDAIHRNRDGGTITLSARVGATGEVEIFTLEPAGDDAAQDAAEAEAESLALPYLRRLIEQEGGSIDFKTVAGGPGAGAMLSAITRLGGRSAPELTRTSVAN
ncbi:MAG: PAS domain-containing sensor histidine kinase [Paracoccaceae bacterium]|nr:PAS domain-containing sensor histidine kinase [Paracoccaceae bacterium]